MTSIGETFLPQTQRSTRATMEGALHAAQEQQHAGNDARDKQIRDLEERIRDLRVRRRKMRRRRHEQQDALRRLDLEHNRQALVLQRKLDAYKSLELETRRAEAFLSTAERWNALDDAFFIQTQGPFATINGLRLGEEALILSQKYAANTVTSASNGTSPPRRRSIFNEKTTQQHLTPTVKVPWAEINAALGQVVLLLVVLTESQTGISYRHELRAFGSKSTVGNYPLYHDGGGLSSLFGRRNLNIALHYLLECVADAFDCILRVDRTLWVPFAINEKESTIGGLAMTHGSDAQGWTRACKYLLINVKHLLLYRAPTAMA